MKDHLANGFAIGIAALALFVAVLRSGGDVVIRGEAPTPVPDVPCERAASRRHELEGSLALARTSDSLNYFTGQLWLLGGRYGKQCGW